MPTGRSPALAGRALAACLALVANLIAAGVPVLHAWAHEIRHHHDGAEAVPAEADHPHDEVHPLALHDEGLLTHRSGPDLTLALAAPRFKLDGYGVNEAPPIHPVPPAASRAPPGPATARAPPLV